MDELTRQHGFQEPGDLLNNLHTLFDKLKAQYNLVPEAVAGNPVDVARLRRHLERTTPTTETGGNPYLSGASAILFGVPIFTSLHIQPGKFYTGTHQEIADLIDWLGAPKTDPLHKLTRVLVPYLSEADALDLLTRYDLQHRPTCNLTTTRPLESFERRECTCDVKHLQNRIQRQVQATGWEQYTRAHIREAGP